MSTGRFGQNACARETVMPRWLRKKLKKNPTPTVVDNGHYEFCMHCGAVWDDNHERGYCGVRDATSRIMAGYSPRKPGE